MSEQLMSPAAGTAKLQEPTVPPIEQVPAFEPWTSLEATTARPEQPDRIDCGIDHDYENPNLIRALCIAVPVGAVCWIVLIELVRFAVHVLGPIGGKH